MKSFSLYHFVVSVTLLAAMLLIASCQGERGPAGPAGPPGTDLTINTLSANPFILDGGDTCLVTVSVTYTGEQALEYVWIADAGTLLGTGPVVRWAAPTTTGDYLISVTVSDDEHSAVGYVTIRVQIYVDVWYHNPANGHYYRLTDRRCWGIADEYTNTNSPTWFDAEDEAQSYGSDTHLVTINDSEENSWLESVFGPQPRWIGFTDHDSISSEGNWVWISGEPVTFTNWDIWQPDNGEGGEDCAHLGHSTPGAWNDLGNIYLSWHPYLPYRGIIEKPTAP